MIVVESFRSLVSMTPNAAGEPTKKGVNPRAVIASIVSGRWQKQVEAIRSLYVKTLTATGDPKAAKKAVDRLKKKLPGIMFAGTFKQRGNDHLEKYSGLLCADLDNLELAVIETAFAKSQTDPHVVAGFKSPTDTGLKIVFRVAGTAEQHDNATFRAVRKHVADSYGLAVDESCKNLERLCFVSFHPQAFWNDNAKPLAPLVESEQPAPLASFATMQIETRRRIAAELLEAITWSTETHGFCTCPGQHLHTTTNGSSDCEIHLDGAPNIHCFHNSCREVVERMNHELPSRIGKAEHHPTMTNKIKPGSVTAEYLGGPAAHRHVVESLPKYSPPPLTLLPSVLRDYVRANAESLDVDVAFIFLPTLSALAAAIGNSRNLRVKKSFVAPPILWTTIVARSGSKKSPALSAATTFFCTRERELLRLNAAAESAFEKHPREWDATNKKTRGEAPRQPRRLTCQLDDLTLAVVAPTLHDNPRGVLVVKDELASWLASFGQFSKTNGGAAADVSGWLQLFNGERLLVDRKTNRESYRIFHPRLSIAGCIPPSVLQSALTKDFFQRGLPARIFFAAPPPRANVWTDAEVPASLESEAATIFRRLFALDAEEREDGAVPKELSIAPDGMEVFKAFFNRVGHHAVESGENEEAAWSKLTGGAARLALVGHLAHGFDLKPVGCTVMEAAVELASWFGREAERMYASFSEPPEAVLCRRFVAFIERQGDAVTVRGIADNFRPLKNKPEEIERQLNNLVASQRGEWLPIATNGKGGRPTRRFRLFGDAPACPCPGNTDIVGERDGFADTDTPSIGKSDGFSNAAETPPVALDPPVENSLVISPELSVEAKESPEVMLL